MREIKFRAWIGNVMIQVTKMDFLKNTDGKYENIGNGYFIDEPNKGLHTDFDMNKAVLLQYTGLKDKNGNEIYESDIVTLYCQESRGEWNDFIVTGKVTYFEECAQFLVKRENTHPQLGFDLFEMCHHEDYELLEMEVIGNIYEHPHLLEGGNG